MHTRDITLKMSVNKEHKHVVELRRTIYAPRRRSNENEPEYKAH